MFKRIDFLVLGIALVLAIFGLAMVASVSVFKSYQITDGTSNAFYLWRSFRNIIVALGGMAVTTLIPYHLWKKLAPVLFGLTLLLLLALFVPGIRAEYGTASSWLDLGPFSLQPSEILKLTMIFYLAVWLQKREQLIGTFKEGFLPFVILLVISTILVAMQPDLGSFLVLTAIAVIMFFIAGGNIFHLLMGGFLALIAGLPIIMQKEYVKDRFRAFLSQEDPTILEGIGYHIKQALITIGSGGMFGVGYGKSIQKFGYLPEVQGDTIFAAMAEELGFFRLLIILTMYGVLVWRAYKIALQAPDRFGFMIATGIGTWIAFQTLLNIAVNLALFPLTGITLPFISYGGTSLLSLMMAVGVLLNVSMHSREEMILSRRSKRRSRNTSLLSNRYRYG